MITNEINTKEIVNFALDNFPLGLQIDILQEECAELIQALSKYKRADYVKPKGNVRENLIEEISHVLISIDVVSSILNINPDEVQNEIAKKCNKYIYSNRKES